MQVVRTIIILLLLSSFSLSYPLNSASANVNRQQQRVKRIEHIQQKLNSLESKYQKRQTKLTQRLTRIQTRYNYRLSTQTYCSYYHLTEQQCIDAWITRNNLNEFGDSRDTVYAGGTPLFNEATGTYIDRYQYIKSHHPNSPWLSMR
jgi:hypothetical protein